MRLSPQFLFFVVFILLINGCSTDGDEQPDSDDRWVTAPDRDYLDDLLIFNNDCWEDYDLVFDKLV